ncbi:RagB/SusD family nutrient uptake outer membrane protein [Chitinophaga arvensicola]|uniref:Starch-binding associating with outer membrane n=1 Tax=Chitinophaga arvensicola TaxID=29529 RepID=A0A1I0PY32_9BACT|nr:RagB/SusD family nutrient uptake outer membrane protein [Chitinophaga arvensicola]SEW19425.1 Starch-binding associating with outer membrane [Chitinophaga arvensicola]
MKYTKLSILALASAGLFSACSKLDQDPQLSLSDQVAVTEDNARILANGMYERMQTLEYYGRDFLIVSDLGGIDMKITSQNSNRFTTEFQMNYTPLVAPQTNTFLNAYRVVNQANVLIVKMPETAKTSTIRGEAYFLRALAELDLAKRYTRPYTNVDAKVTSPNTGITLVTTTPDAPATAKPGRSTLEETYTAIINDLKVAQQTAPDAKPNTAAVFKASKDAATALLTRVYVYKGQWQLAIDEATKLIGKYPLYEPALVAGAFNKDEAGSEEIFSLRFLTPDGAGSNNFGYLYVPASKGGYGDVRLTDEFMGLLDPKDVRLGYTLNLDGSNYLMKFSGNPATGQVGLVNVKIARISEVLLNRAEAYAELGNLQKATDDINLLRAKRGLDPFTDVAKVKAEIVKQRRLELVGEGFGMTDLYRKNGTRNITDANALSTRKTEPNDIRVAYPIPQAEMDANPNMVQNPGYSN